MMKRMLMSVLVLVACLCMLGGSALAANGTIIAENDEADAGAYHSITDVAVAGDTAYFRVYMHHGESIWYWREGMAKAELAVDRLIRATMYGSIQDAEGDLDAQKAKYAITALFSDGERLLGLNHLNGLVYEMKVQNGEVVCSDVVTLKDTTAFYRDYDTDPWYWSPKSVTAAGDYMYWFSSGWSASVGRNLTRVTCFSLVDGSSRDLPVEDVMAISRYRDDKLVLLCQDVNQRDANGDLYPYEVRVYDPITGEAGFAGTLDEQRHLSRIVYAPDLDALLYHDGTSIMGLKAMNELTRYAYVNATGAGMLNVIGDTLLFTRVGSCMTRDLVEGLTAADSLQVLRGSLGAAERKFVEKYPGVPLEFPRMEDEEEYATLLRPVEGEPTIDVVWLNTVTDDWAYRELCEGGNLLDLSADPEIAAYVEALYPAFRELVTGENGEIWAVPTQTSSYTGVFINRKAMNTMGLTVEEMPRNLVELCEFVNRWNEEFADSYPNYACIEYTEDTRWYLLDMMMEMWIAYCDASGQALHFDDPVFREMMAALEKVDVVHTDTGMQVTDPEISDYKSGLFWMRCQLVGNWAAYMEEFSDRIFIPMTLTEDTPFVATVDNVELWVVNRDTDSQDFALKLINEQISAVNDKYAHVLLTTRTEPVENPWYAESLATEQKNLARLQTELDRAQSEEHRQTVQVQYDALDAYINNELRRSMYDVTPSAIENYLQVLVPALHVHRQNVLEDTGEGITAMESAMRRWLDGAITTEQMIRELDARVMMLEIVR